MDVVVQKDVSRRSALAGADPVVNEILVGLTSEQKFLNPKFFYDERGSELFDCITELPEYYPTRTEIGILRDRAPTIAECVGPDPVIIEPGAGSCEKIRYLLNDLKPAAYVPQDISADFLQRTAEALRADAPWLPVCPVVGDFAEGIGLPESLPETRRVAFYPGSTIGNFEPNAAVGFLRTLRQLVGESGGIVVGVDLQKEVAVLNAAYNDKAGVTAEFNRNILRHVNRILDIEIDPETFSHRAFYNVAKNRVEMHLVCEQPQRIECNGVQLQFARGESIHTESSYKYTLEGFARLAEAAGFRLVQAWTDDRELFSVNYLA